MAVVTIIILMSLVVFLERNKRLKQANDLIRAYQALSNEAEAQRHLPFSALKTQASFSSDTAVLAPLAPYTADVVVTPKSLGVKDVTLILRWENDKREAKLRLVRVAPGGESNLW